MPTEIQSDQFQEIFFTDYAAEFSFYDHLGVPFAVAELDSSFRPSQFLQWRAIFSMFVKKHFIFNGKGMIYSPFFLYGSEITCRLNTIGRLNSTMKRTWIPVSSGLLSPSYLKFGGLVKLTKTLALCC